MKLENVQGVLEAQPAFNKNSADYSSWEIDSSFAGDLISDVIANAQEGYGGYLF